MEQLETSFTWEPSLEQYNRAVLDPRETLETSYLFYVVFDGERVDWKIQKKTYVIQRWTVWSAISVLTQEEGNTTCNSLVLLVHENQHTFFLPKRCTCTHKHSICKDCTYTGLHVHVTSTPTIRRQNVNTFLHSIYWHRVMANLHLTCLLSTWNGWPWRTSVRSRLTPSFFPW